MVICKTSANPTKSACHRLFVADKAYGDGVVVWKIKFRTSSTGDSVVGGIGIVSDYVKCGIT